MDVAIRAAVPRDKPTVFEVIRTIWGGTTISERRSTTGCAGAAIAYEVETFGSDVPLGRPGQPEEVAPSFVFLASDDVSYMSGQCLHPNGGETINT